MIDRMECTYEMIDRGYENIRYYVNEVEGNFHFYCEDVSIFMTTL